MADNTKTSTTVSGRGLNRRTTISTTTVDDNGNSYTRTKTSRSVGEKLGSGLGVFGLIVGVLLSVSLIRSLMGGSSITFGGLLEYLSNAPTINMSLKSFDVIAPLQWGVGSDGVVATILSSISNFLNIFITIFNVLLFAFKGLGQVIVYIVYFVRFLF